jgi:toxin YoeB
MKHTLDISILAQEGLSKLKKSEPKAFVKAVELLEELSIHPRTGTGQPEFCKYEKKWSRRITRKHRLTYTISDFNVIVSIISVLGHYKDK